MRAMSSVHQLIIHQGIEEARRRAESKHDRLLVEAAYQVLSEGAEKIGFTYSGFALTSLPHKPHNDLVWKREGHHLTLFIESGRDRSGNAVGLPYGSYARFILLFLQSEAIRTNSREIELGRSMRVWLGTMGLSIGGTTYRMVNEQANRISHCRLQFFADRDGREIMRHGGFVDGTISMSEGSHWEDRVFLNEEFFRALRDHPVPVSTSALKAIGPRSMAIDVYIWLAYRLHALNRSVDVTWPALYSQFGCGFQLIRKFRAHFIQCLELAVAAYPDARVAIDARGLTLHPSRPAIAKP